MSELYNKDLEGQYCKTTKDGRFTHQHVVYTEGFLSKYKDILPDGVNFEHIKTLAAMHHRPSTYHDWIISHADRLSSGSDRCNILGIAECSDENQFDEEKQKLKFYEKPMIHILSTLHLDNCEKIDKAFCKMSALDEDSVLPVESSRTSKEEYKNLWKDFVRDFQKLKNLGYDKFLLALNSLLERYWWCIPSATNSDADISLYQHAKTTAAFAAALYEYHKEKNTENENALKENDDKKFLFVNGDISGIQNYIFDLKTSADNAKLLRAKSFQLWALSEIISQYITKQFGVTYANIMTSAGGKFIILLPNTEKSKKCLEQLRLEIEAYFLKEFAGKLTFIVSSGTEASSDDLRQSNVSALINKIDDDGDIAKSKKMQKVLKKYGAVLESQYEQLQKYGECPTCGLFAARNSENTDEIQCKSCEKLIEIGRKLVKSAKVELKSDKLLPFGDMIKLYEWDEDVDFYYSVNDYKPGFPLITLPYTAPKNDDEELLTFEDIAKKSQGNERLAMFKADIDNLGLVFNQSLRERMSFSRYADLSHLLHYFFSAFYSWFVNNKKDQFDDFYKEKIYTVFSGGDDLCILGTWESVMQFAVDFQKELRKFTNNNPSVTISGGIALANAKLPVGNIADEAERNLELSKDYSGKNAVTIFGTTVSWADYEKCLENGKFFAQCLKEEKLSTGVIYKFIDFANRAEKILGSKDNVADVSELVNTKDRIWKSNLIYVLARNVKDEALKKKLTAFGSTPQEMIKSRIAVSYALYMNR
ncbi:MAG: type III-A CRISPR-associated protein Cas10/Csm1 [Bacteroides sp.]|nr:type III-A CRISPR-associated protein Cas10/Csm1 [Prevotella sp.]MCM1406950.1 type III-A CRISPR-associated protein Cas10/Csm1 [Treponema brennaborense]MCM1470101.1 type III-A CRISPR-associated protein Cas10/Csm1 [Bacteroides sp.]